MQRIDVGKSADNKRGRAAAGELPLVPVIPKKKGKIKHPEVPKSTNTPKLERAKARTDGMRK